MASSSPDDLAVMSRMACFGSEDGTFHVLKKVDLTNELRSVKSILSMNRGQEAIKRLKTIAKHKSYVKKENMLFTLANVIHEFNQPEKDHKNDSCCQEAFNIVQEVCETPYDLFAFVHFDKKISSTSKVSWGRGMRNMILKWYRSKPPHILAQEITRCKSGYGFSHKDLIKQSHIKCDGISKGFDLVMNYLLKGKAVLQKAEEEKEDDEEVGKVIKILQDVEQLTASQPTEKEVIRSLIETNGFMERQIPSHFFKLREAYEGLIGHISLSDLIKAVPKMAELGLLDPMSSEAEKIVDRLDNADSYKQERISPVAVFIAMRKYDVNRFKKWIRNPRISQALHNAYHLSLENGLRTSKRYLLAVHVDSKIVKNCVTGSASTLSPIMPCAILAQLLMKVEDSPVCAYFRSDTTIELDITKASNTVGIVEQMVQRTKERVNDTYDISDPIKWAIKNKKQFDCILIVCGKKRVSSQADLQSIIRAYRKESGIADAKVAIVGLNDPTPLPDVDDLNYLDVTGFDEDVLDLVQHFFKGFPE